MTLALGLGTFTLGLLITWGAVTNRNPVQMIVAGFTGGDFADADPIDGS